MAKKLFFCASGGFGTSFNSAKKVELMLHGFAVLFSRADELALSKGSPHATQLSVYLSNQESFGAVLLLSIHIPK